MLLCLQMRWQMILILRYFFFFFFKSSQAKFIKTGISHTTSPHSQHHPADTLTRDITCFEGKRKVNRAKVKKKGKELEEDGRVKSSGEIGAQFTEAALNQPITVKENISWCISSFHKEERMKGEESECI